MDDILSSGPPTVKSSLIMGIFSGIAVAVRLYAKSITKVRFTTDDYWILFSLASYWAYIGLMIWNIFRGGGGLNMINFLTYNLDGIALYLKV